MADIRGVVLHKILTKEDGYLDAWAKIKSTHFSTEYAPIYRAVAKFYSKHNELPTFDDLEVYNRNPVLKLSLIALQNTEIIDVELDLAVEALLNEYTQEEVLTELDQFVDTITVLDSEEIKQELGNILLNIEEKTQSSEDIILMNQIQFEKDAELLGLMPLGLNNTFDSELGGMAPTEVLGIGGYRGTGKSNVCCNLSVNQYLAGNTSLYFSIEMRAREIFNRHLALLSGVDLSKISLARLNDTELALVAKTRAGMFYDAEELYQEFLERRDYARFERQLVAERELKKDNQVILVDNQNLTLENIDLLVHRYKTQFEDKLKIVLVDYLNQINIPNKYEWKVQIEISARLKAIARKYDIILVSPYQIDKTGETRFSKGIEDSMDICMRLEKSEGRIDFISTKSRGKKKFEFASPVDESTMRIDANDLNLPPKETKAQKKEDKENQEQAQDMPW